MKIVGSMHCCVKIEGAYQEGIRRLIKKSFLVSVGLPYYDHDS
jgi:hypothetical protein